MLQSPVIIFHHFCWRSNSRSRPFQVSHLTYVFIIRILRGLMALIFLQFTATFLGYFDPELMLISIENANFRRDPTDISANQQLKSPVSEYFCRAKLHHFGIPSSRTYFRHHTKEHRIIVFPTNLSVEYYSQVRVRRGKCAFNR